MITTLTGPNNLLLKQALKDTTDAFIKEQGDTALEKLDGEDASYDRIQEAINSVPFLASKKLVVLHAPSSNKDFTEKAEDLLKDLPETTDLVLVEPKLDKRLQYYKLLKKITDFKEFGELDNQATANWLVSYAKQNNAKLSPADARYLIERVGNNQQFLKNELDKLIAYNQSITKETIDLLTDQAPHSTIFELVDAALAGNTKKALTLYEEQRGLKVEPQQIIAMLAWQLNVLAIIKTAGNKTTDEIAKETKVNPYVLRKNSGLAKKMSLADLKSHIKNLSQLDVKTKRASIDIDEALKHYLLTISS